MSRFGPVLLLTVVASFQQLLAHSRNLSPWKGGGFGMFSTVDSPSARFVRVYLTVAHQELAVAVPPHLGQVARELRTLPTRSRIEHFTVELIRSAWKVAYLRAPAAGAGSSEGLEIPIYAGMDTAQPSPPGLSSVFPERVRVEVWQYRFDRATSRLQATKLDESSREFASVRGGPSGTGVPR